MALRAPESLLEDPIDHTIDIWSFGCLVFEFLTGSLLFQISGLSGIPQEQNDDDHLLQMISTLGHPPPEIYAKWPRRARHFDEDMRLIRSDVGANELCELFQGPSLEDAFEESRPKETEAEECTQVLSLLRMILQYESSLRLSTTALLEHPWFRPIQ